MFLTKSYRSTIFFSKYCLWCVAWVLCITIFCVGVGCDTGDDVVTPTEPEGVEPTVPTVEVIDRYDGDSILFEENVIIRGERVTIIYEALVIEGVSEDEVLVRLVDGSKQVLPVDRIAGTLIDNFTHPDLGTLVKLLGEQEGESTLTGKIVGVYDNGVRKIEIFNVIFVEGGGERLDVPRIRLVHEDTDFEDGGYLTRDEFREWLLE